MADCKHGVGADWCARSWKCMYERTAINFMWGAAGCLGSAAVVGILSPDLLIVAVVLAACAGGCAGLAFMWRELVIR